LPGDLVAGDGPQALSHRSGWPTMARTAIWVNVVGTAERFDNCRAKRCPAAGEGGLRAEAGIRPHLHDMLLMPGD